MMLDTLSTTATAAGLSWTSGIRLYMALFIAGWFGRMEWIHLPQALEVLQNEWVIGVTGTLTVIEFLTDKIPVVDTLWDGIQTFIRIPAGAILAAATFGEMSSIWTTIAALLGGTLAASTHATKASSRAVINTSPEPMSNLIASVCEDAIVAGALLITFFHPWLLLAFLIVFTLFAMWLLPKVWKNLKVLSKKFSKINV